MAKDLQSTDGEEMSKAEQLSIVSEEGEDIARQIIQSIEPIKNGKHRIKYSPTFKQTCIQLYLAGLKNCQIVRAVKREYDVDLPVGTLSAWVHGMNMTDVERETVAEEVKKNLITKFMVGASRFATEALKPEKMEKMNSFQASTISCQMIDKYMKLTGQDDTKITFVYEKRKQQSDKVIDVTSSVTDIKDDLGDVDEDIDDLEDALKGLS